MDCDSRYTESDHNLEMKSTRVKIEKCNNVSVPMFVLYFVLSLDHVRLNHRMCYTVFIIGSFSHECFESCTLLCYLDDCTAHYLQLCHSWMWVISCTQRSLRHNACSWIYSALDQNMCYWFNSLHFFRELDIDMFLFLVLFNTLHFIFVN